jgi:hypothetical protein
VAWSSPNTQAFVPAQKLGQTDPFQLMTTAPVPSAGTKNPQKHRCKSPLSQPLLA